MVRAAVLPALCAPLEVRHDVEVAPPGPGEVRVRMAAAGVCHSDLSVQSGVLPQPLPMVLGHEGAGVVESVGPGVTGAAPGDSVVISWVPQCGTCYFCRRGQPGLCQEADAILFSGVLLDGTPRLRSQGADLFQMTAAGTFSELTVVPATGVVRLPPDFDMVVAAMLGCGVLTGVGAAMNTASIREGDAVAVIGCGGVGLNVVQGARIAGAAEVIAVDVNATKLAWAEKLGATSVVDASTGDPVAAVRDLTGHRGADVAVEAIGRADTIHQTVAMTRRGGQAILVGLPPLDATLQLSAMLDVILQERTIKGCWHGSSDLRRDIPRLVDLYRSGQLRLDELVSRRIALDDVNVAFEAMVEGQVTRSVIVY